MIIFILQLPHNIVITVAYYLINPQFDFNHVNLAYGARNTFYSMIFLRERQKYPRSTKMIESQIMYTGDSHMENCFI